MSEKTKPIHKRIISALMRRGYFDWMNDAAYLKLKYKIAIGRKLDLKNPQTFNEKLQWLKLHDRKAIYTTMVDKYAVKEYVASIIGEEHVIPTLGVWDSFDEIDFDLLPDQFVLKCTHDSGGLVICKDKSKLDINEAKRKIEKSLKTNYYLQGREWPYKDVPRRIIAEKYMVDESGTELRDYKIHNFNGVPRMILVCRDRFEKSGLTEDFYSEKWEHLDIKRPSHPNAEYPQEIPAALQKMLNLSKKLAQDIPFVRTDFYVVGNHIYFGEMTFFPASGMERFEPPVVDEQLGKWLVICGGGYILKGNGFYLWIHENESGDECQDFTNKELLDYKLMCFDGKVRCSFVCSDRFSEDGLKVTFFDNDWNMLPFERHYPKSSKPIAKPESFKKMVEFAEKLSQNIPFVRVDFYEVNGNLYFGELTFYPGSGMEEFRPESADYDLGQMIKLPVIGGGYWIETNEFCLWIHGVPNTSCKAEKRDNSLIDYKFYCFNGIPEYCQVITDRYSAEKIDFFDMNWRHQDFTGLALPGCPYPHAGHPIVCPNSFEAMKLAAVSLSKNIPFSRIDFYEVTGRMYFGEITLFPASGFGVFEPDNWNYTFGEKIDI